MVGFHSAMVADFQRDMACSALFVTGMQRCGTTLLEKLLCNHPQLSVLSQPSPFLFLEAKRSFLRQISSGDDEYPLGDLFSEDRYEQAAFNDYLLKYRFDRPTLRELFTSMSSYSGQYTRFDSCDIDSFLKRLACLGLAETLTQQYRDFAHNRRASLFGAKETICEEFLPYLLGRGFRCVVIVRDPRDMLASLNYGRGSDYGGSIKPTLFNLRNWRKSVAFVLHLQNTPGFAWVRYEDLVDQPVECMNRIAAVLDVSAVENDVFARGVLDQKGENWPGNSSHSSQQGISRQSAGNWRRVLSPEVAYFAEAICYPELRALGYSSTLQWADVAGALQAFEEPYEISRPTLRERFRSPERIDEELARVRSLTGEQSSVRHFIFEDVRLLLRKAIVS
jgi:hypothetical protein